MSSTSNTSTSALSQAEHHQQLSQRVSMAGLLITIGIVFGDIGTSPLYTLSAIFGERVVTYEGALGVFSCIFWTLTLQTSVKYVFITLKADNNGEGGIFSLYALVRRYRQWLLIPAIIGGGFLLADGIITPPISVSSAIEGLLEITPELNTVPIVIGILVALFFVQQFGTNIIGGIFGPVMLVWFVFIGVIGLLEMIKYPEVLMAINPLYGYNLLVNTPGGFWVLGGVFLCTTGAEALYSDMGHCGKSNIRVSWGFVKIALLLNYAGQTSYLINHTGTVLHNIRPFYAIVPQFLLLPSIILATMSAVIASQALISGSYTLISEAMRLDIWPKLKVIYPTRFKGQIYVPAVNWAFMVGCIGVVLHFRESKNMEAAYGLAVTLTMLMTTILMCMYLYIKRTNIFIIMGLAVLYFGIEGSFLVANMAKFPQGGWLSLVIGAALIYIMYMWAKGHSYKQKLIQLVPTEDYLPMLRDLSNDESISKYATHVVYLTSSNNSKFIETRIPYSIFQRTPKRADVYWFLHVNVLDEPYAARYKVEKLVEQDVIWITFNLGFKVETRINLYFRMAVEELVKNKEIDITSRYLSLSKQQLTGDFRFVLFDTFLSYENALPMEKKITMNTFFALRHISIGEKAAFGLDTSNTEVEKVPLIINQFMKTKLEREF